MPIAAVVCERAMVTLAALSAVAPGLLAIGAMLVQFLCHTRKRSLSAAPRRFGLELRLTRAAAFPSLEAKSAVLPRRPTCPPFGAHRRLKGRRSLAHPLPLSTISQHP